MGPHGPVVNRRTTGEAVDFAAVGPDHVNVVIAAPIGCVGDVISVGRPNWSITVVPAVREADVSGTVGVDHTNAAIQARALVID